MSERITFPPDWVVRPRPAPSASLRLLCIPHAGSGPVVFFKWAAHFPAAVELWNIRLPGRGTRLREASHTDISALVNELAAALQPYLNAPFAIFGHSLGALIGYELTQHLRRQNGPQPVHLLVSGHRAPHRPPLNPPIHQAGDVALLRRVKGLGGTATAVFADKELIQLMLPPLRADFTLWENYRYPDYPPLPCPITAFCGYDDSEAKEADIAAWAQHTDGQFSMRMFVGDHFYFQPNALPLLQAITRTLASYLAMR
jgi:medium-chain acyl-[acyl-carrier-protein] hydrolase